MATKKTTKKDRVEELVRLTEEISSLIDQNGLTIGETDSVLAALWGETWCTVEKSVVNLAAMRFFGKCLKALERFREEASGEDAFMAAFEKEYKTKNNENAK